MPYGINIDAIWHGVNLQADQGSQLNDLPYQTKCAAKFIGVLTRAVRSTPHANDDFIKCES